MKWDVAERNKGLIFAAIQKMTRWELVAMSQKRMGDDFRQEGKLRIAEYYHLYDKKVSKESTYFSNSLNWAIKDAARGLSVVQPPNSWQYYCYCKAHHSFETKIKMIKAARSWKHNHDEALLELDRHDYINEFENREDLKLLLIRAKLSNRELDILIMRFLEDFKLQEIADKYGFSRERARQIIRDSLIKIRFHIEVEESKLKNKEMMKREGL